jgi:hypothetical protein
VTTAIVVRYAQQREPPRRSCRLQRLDRGPVICSLAEQTPQAVISLEVQLRQDEAAALWPWLLELRAVEVQPWPGRSVNLQDEVLLSSDDDLENKLQALAACGTPMT